MPNPYDGYTPSKKSANAPVQAHAHVHAKSDKVPCMAWLVAAMLTGVAIHHFFTFA